LSCSIYFNFQGTLSLHQVKVRGRDSVLSFGCGFAAENATRGVVVMNFGAGDASGALAVHKKISAATNIPMSVAVK
jgi:hypothetical protein